MREASKDGERKSPWIEGLEQTHLSHPPRVSFLHPHISSPISPRKTEFKIYLLANRVREENSSAEAKKITILLSMNHAKESDSAQFYAANPYALHRLNSSISYVTIIIQ